MGKEKEVKTEMVEEEVDRGSWDNQCDFFLSCLGFAVGLGNVWRFPYLCYQHGGVTFVIAYMVMLMLCGLPLFFLELVLGQYSSRGPVKLFSHMSPGFKGLGYALVYISFLSVIYYNLIIAWAFYYTCVGFTSELPWTYCGNTNLTSKECFQKDQELACFNMDMNTTFWDRGCSSVAEVCEDYNMVLAQERDGMDRLMCFNGTQNMLLNKVYPRVSPSEDYFKRTVLGLEPETSWSDLGGLKWDLVACLAAAWTIVSLCLIKGVQSSGKVVYVTALFPYLVLLILLIRGVTLDGAYEGILFYVYPTQEKLANLKNIDVWASAATQIFYSLGTSLGGLMTMASYNKFSNNCHRDAILIAFINCATSIFAGFVIFSIIGFMAKQAELPVEEVIKGGPGLVFIAYPEAVTQMPFPQLWSFLFFAMVLTLGLDTQFTMTETITSAILDQYPHLRKHKGKVMICTGVIGFIMGLTMCTRGGIFMFELINWYSAGWVLLICSIIEVVIMIHIYGHQQVFANIEEMGMRISTPMKWYWLATWKVVTPVSLIFILIMSLVQYSPAYSPSYSQEDYVFPGSIQCLGWLMSLVPVVLIIIGGTAEYVKQKRQGTFTGSSSLMRPSEKWGPAKDTVGSWVKKEVGLDNKALSQDTYAHAEKDIELEEKTR